MTNLRKMINALLWKNYILRRCHWIITILELVVPIVLFVGIVSLNAYFGKKYQNFNPNAWEHSTPEELPESYIYNEFPHDYKLFYTPVNDATKEMMELVSTELHIKRASIIPMDSEADMEFTCKQIMRNISLDVYGIVFEDNLKPSSKVLNYALRSSKYYDTTLLYTHRNSFSSSEKYMMDGLLALQLAVEKSFAVFVGTKLNASFFVQKFPDIRMSFKSGVLELLFITTVFSFIFLCPAILKRIVEEKSSGAKELMKLMGLSSLVLWFGWLLHSMALLIISVTVISIILVIPFEANQPVLHSSIFVVWIFLMLYCYAVVFFLFAISGFFKRPTLAMVFGILVWVSSYIAAQLIQIGVNSRVLFWHWILIIVFPNFGLASGYNAMFYYENRNIGLSLLDVLCSSWKSSNQIQLGQIWIVFFAQIFFYFLLTIYLEAIFPGNYGVSKPWYFPVMNFVQLFTKNKRVEDKISSGYEDSESFEPLKTVLPIGIRLRNLRKVFGSIWSRETKVSVDGVSLDICKGEITALLGHNGAGKSTTMLMLTGMLEPTSGTVHIDDYDTRYQMMKIRENLGFCPQHNLLFFDLTVSQHLTFYAMVKGCSDVKSEVHKYVEKLKLQPHVNKKPDQLSGGYKRRLCLAVAFIGRSRTVILDEPTSGLDPEARREIWDLLLSMRGERTILVTTHSMEEADVLGDRIAIMDHGQIQCYGTPIFLKKYYGTGYNLSIQKDVTSDEMLIIDAVKNVVSGAEIKSSMPSLLNFRLPAHETALFPSLFSELQENRERLGVKSVGVSITTMEEVFLRVGEMALESSKKNEDTFSNSTEKSGGSLPLLSPCNVKGSALLFQQIEALFIKRIRVLNWSYLLQVIIQVVMMMIVIWICVFPHSSGIEPPLKLELNMYDSTNVFLADNNSPVQLTKQYKDLVSQFGSSIEPVPSEENIIDSLLKKENEENPDYTMKYVVAAEFNNSGAKATALYSNIAVHSLPISLNLLTNAYLKYLKNDPEYSLSVTNNPFHIEEAQYFPKEMLSVLWMSLVPLSLTFWMGLFTILPLQERVSGCKQLQRMSGVNVPLYWLTIYISDLQLHLLLTLLLIIAVSIVDVLKMFSTPIELANLFIIFMLYGVSAIPFSYLISFWKDTWAGCYAILIIINLITGIILKTIVITLEPLGVTVVDSINGVMLLVPNYALTSALYVYVSQVVYGRSCLLLSEIERQQECGGEISQKSECCSCKDGSCYTTNISYLEINKTALLYLGLSHLLYLGLIMFIDLGIMQQLWEKIVARLSLSSDVSHEIDDDDVQNETSYIEKFFTGQTHVDTGNDLVVYDLKKKYGLSSKPPAVKSVSFQVRAGECFGLLGVNGAGKTTTFKMLTGSVVPTSGSAIIGKYKLNVNKSQYLSQIGYCPQQDALLECLSARKLLRLIGALRGVPRHVLDAEVDRWIDIMGLQECQNRCSGKYSGGNKRKLSTAMALIGSPPLVFLDEPTCGVDPVARRNLWNILIALQKSGESIVLTSHSMEECEILCNRLAIMANGQLVCIGSIPQLKMKFQQGSTIKIKVAAGSGSEALENIKSQMRNTFTESVLKDEHETLLHYQVKDSSWGKMFETMEKMKQTHTALEDYTISETSLEEVFLSFAQN